MFIERLRSISPLPDVRSTVDTIIIPENATNGDMIKAMFPNVEVKEKNNGYEVYFGVGTAIQFFNHQWWNASYEKEVKSESEDQPGCMCYSCKKIITNGRIFRLKANPKKGLCFDCY